MKNYLTRYIRRIPSCLKVHVWAAFYQWHQQHSISHLDVHVLPYKRSAKSRAAYEILMVLLVICFTFKILIGNIIISSSSLFCRISEIIPIIMSSLGQVDLQQDLGKEIVHCIRCKLTKRFLSFLLVYCKMFKSDNIPDSVSFTILK